MNPRKNDISKKEQKLGQMVWGLFRLDLDLIGKVALKLVDRLWQNKPIRPQRVPKPHPELPKAPFLPLRPRQRGDLLLFVPRSLESLLIDHLTGSYGYSHLAVDCGENDITGKPVMIESTTGEVVQKKYQDEYGPRRFVRIPLRRAGVAPDAFCDCVASKLGEAYDDLEAITWGDIDDPAKQVCSDLAAVCLPNDMREDIAKQAREGKLRRFSVSVHSRPSDHNLREFISPNGFAEYFGAPRGKDVKQPDQMVLPKIAGETQPASGKGRFSWLIVLLITAGGLVWLLRHKPRPQVIHRRSGRLGPTSLPSYWRPATEKPGL